MFKPYSSSPKVTKHSLCCKICRITFLPASGSMRGSPWPCFQGLAHSIGWLRRRRSLTWAALRVTLWPHCSSWSSPLICTLGYIRERTWEDHTLIWDLVRQAAFVTLITLIYHFGQEWRKLGWSVFTVHCLFLWFSSVNSPSHRIFKFLLREKLIWTHHEKQQELVKRSCLGYLRKETFLAHFRSAILG